jgi:hypothetical protein
MRDTWRRLTLAAAGAAVISYTLIGCGGDDESAPKYRYRLGSAEILGPGLGLSEWSDDGPGDRRVLQVADPEVDADEPTDRTVTALVEFCAPKHRPDEPASADWSLVLDDGGFAEATGEPRPTDDGSPPLPATGRIDAGDCALADIDFTVPGESVTVGMVFRPATGGRVRWSWAPSDTRTDQAS